MHLAVGRNSVDFIPFTYWSVEKKGGMGSLTGNKKGGSGYHGRGRGMQIDTRCSQRCQEQFMGQKKKKNITQEGGKKSRGRAFLQKRSPCSRSMLCDRIAFIF